MEKVLKRALPDLYFEDAGTWMFDFLMFCDILNVLNSGCLIDDEDSF